MQPPNMGSNDMALRDDFMQEAYGRIRSSVTTTFQTAPTLPTPAQLSTARSSLPSSTAITYLTSHGPQATLNHLLTDIAPGLNGQNRSSRYWGFVTGGTLPIAEVADNLVSAYDQNVSVHLPGQTIVTEVEDAALKMLVELLGLGNAEDWEGRTLTTGATASNVLGLGCGREGVVGAKLARLSSSSSASPEHEGVGELGLLNACLKARIMDIQVLTSMGHSSLSKAASIVGLGRASVKELPHSADQPWRLDLDAVEKELQREGVASIIAVSAGEVNTGRFATTGLEDMQRLRSIADRHGAWIHVDGAFGIFARLLPQTEEFAQLHQYAAGLELADSITVDGHKLLNVPYDLGIFFTRKASTLTNVCKNPNAAYLPSGGGTSDIQSPLDVGIENSRRFRALPVYTVLMSEGRDGITEMLTRMVCLARRIAAVVKESEDYILLPDEASLEDTHIIVLFRAKDDELNKVLVDTINTSCKWYVGGTKWRGQTAVRLAVANWRVDVEVDLAMVKSSLAMIAQNHRRNSR